MITKLDNTLLDPADFFNWQDCAKDTSWNKDSICYIQDLLNIFNGFFILQFGYDLYFIRWELEISH